MGTRRNRSGSTPSVQSSPQTQRARQQRAQPPVPSPAPEPTQSPAMGMSPMSKYNHNLKVLRRRDPSIVSIFDQFSHVCVYHHNGSKWEKQGFEGTMFLYERDSYPPYGFYILNRVGMDDYIQRLYPEDSMQAHESYLMMRSYPNFTSHRLSIARASLPPQRAEGTLSKFAPEFAISDPEKLLDSEKGTSQTVSLWCFATDARDPMQDVMIRLHSYIKKNLPYPETFRYAPDRPPPANLQLITNGIHEPNSKTIEPPANANSSLDTLFSKLQSPAGPPASISVNRDTSSISTESHASSRGLALLDSIFASASSPALSYEASPEPVPSASLSFSGPPSTRLSHSQTILSPKPTPQILTQDVISSLLGMTSSASPEPASPSSSTVLSSSSSRRSEQYQYRYEGDNEDEASDGSDGGFSASVSSTSTALDVDADCNVELQAAGASAGIPILSAPEQGSGLGDRTPRPPLRGMDSDGVDLNNNIRTSTPPPSMLSALRTRMRPHQLSPTLTTPYNVQICPSSSAFANSSLPSHIVPSLAKSSSSSTINADFTKPSIRPLVPFSADSELWPYPRAPVDDRSNSIDNEGVVELDFADTSALSDLRMFQEKERASKNTKGSGNKDIKKKGKRERAEERERERDEIEKSWDVPSRVPPTPPPVTINGKGKMPVKASSLPAVNGTNGVDSDAVKTSIISTLSSRNSKFKSMPRNDFVKEVLTLIHTDRNFVDKLWREYNSLSG